MKLPLYKRILGHLYFVYALTLFALTMLIVVVPIWLTTLFDEPRRAHWMHPIFRLWMGVYMPLAFCPVFRKGKKYFQPGKNYVVVCNHNSFADVPVSSPWIPGPNKTLAKAEMARIPIFGVIYKAGSVLVDRKSESSRRDSFLQMEKMLEKGLHLCLYPEGTRNKTSQPLQNFHKGAFRTAIEVQLPVVPALIFNTRDILPGKPGFWAWPRKIHFHFLPPVETAGLKREDAEALKERVRALMLEYYVANREQLG
ncbi:MAG: 1-acyl-sn-glycerol-3-phosphate acyltransferase [Bacteroidetes bacterium]|nr:1-acyl-sn-glycerol-3-phosphate acyltransferase [Bacteroidota bacterium]MBS1630677.1 1-acyl-sn-glycerol-3-phosphate acyltransferase [Bacteroidota bacterium]